MRRHAHRGTPLRRTLPPQSSSSGQSGADGHKRGHQWSPLRLPRWSSHELTQPQPHRPGLVDRGVHARVHGLRPLEGEPGGRLDVGTVPVHELGLPGRRRDAGQRRDLAGGRRAGRSGQPRSLTLSSTTSPGAGGGRRPWGTSVLLAKVRSLAEPTPTKGDFRCEDPPHCCDTLGNTRERRTLGNYVCENLSDPRNFLSADV